MSHGGFEQYVRLTRLTLVAPSVMDKKRGLCVCGVCVSVIFKEGFWSYYQEKIVGHSHLLQASE